MSANITGVGGAQPGSVVSHSAAAETPVIARSNSKAEPKLEREVPAQKSVNTARLEQQKKASEEKQQPAEEYLEKATDKMNNVMNALGKGLRFQVHDRTNELYVEIINKQTNEVLRSIPSEEMLDLMDRMHSALGMILDVEV